MTSRRSVALIHTDQGFLRRSDGWGWWDSTRGSGSVRCRRNVTVR
nr:MAG TPA: hypothetical protein [Caudoviricetes sp.]